MAVHPFGTMHVEGSDRDRRIIKASIDQLDKSGTGQWVGFSFPWYSCIAARAGYAERALDKLEIFVKAFISRNGFNLNGDYKKQGYSVLTYRPFTLEANFGAAQAVHEMLLQSWGQTIRVFPAVSKRWPDVSFDDLHAEGGFRVSAKRKDGKTHSVRIQADAGGLLRLRDPFDGKKVTWNRNDVKLVGQDYECRLASDEVLEGRL
jgi:alpha-L-fucosidase 2